MTTLRTDRLLLRPFQLTDVDDVYTYARDPEWGRYLTVPRPYEHRHAVEFVARSVLAPWDTNPAFAICLSGRCVGGINIRVDTSAGTGEIGYSIARADWGKGLTAEAAAAVMGWAFDEFDLAKITAMADVANTRSSRVMEKLGMRRDGVLRSERPSDADPGTRQDMVIYSVLRDEWQARASG
ncbi:MAG: GNAT family protein [Gammaproteobacteria bacterium]|nr:GNAT family protein [Gammaproteobacteria bacterium]